MFEMKAQRSTYHANGRAAEASYREHLMGFFQVQGQCSRQGKAFLVPRQLPTVGMVPGARHSSWPLQLRV